MLQKNSAMHRYIKKLGKLFIHDKNLTIKIVCYIATMFSAVLLEIGSVDGVLSYFICIIGKKFSKLKILGNGEFKQKMTISANFVSKQAKLKLEKSGSTLNLLKK